jgi:hypothetical protein
MSDPPLFVGAVQVIVAVASPGEATTDVGAPGTCTAGVTLFDGSDGNPVPRLFVAVTVNVYGCPSVSPDTVQLRAPVVVHVRPSGELVTV